MTQKSQSKKYAFFVGRWQAPGALHDGHIWCFNEKLKKGIPVLIGIRDVEQDDKNPYTSKEVEAMIHLRLAEQIEAGMVRTIIIPDIESVVYGREVGYSVEQLIPPPEIGKISGTSLRAKKEVIE